MYTFGLCTFSLVFQQAGRIPNSALHLSAGVLPVWGPAEWREPGAGGSEAAARSPSHTRRRRPTRTTAAARWCRSVETDTSGGTSSRKPDRTAPPRPWRLLGAHRGTKTLYHNVPTLHIWTTTNDSRLAWDTFSPQNQDKIKKSLKNFVSFVIQYVLALAHTQTKQIWIKAYLRRNVM